MMIAEKTLRIPDTAEKLYRTHFPYGIRKMNNGKYFMFNREYQPVGSLKDKIGSIYNDSDIPEDITFNAELTSEVINKISINHSQTPDLIFLYDDRTKPILSNENMAMYLEKLKVIMTIKAW